MVPEICNLISGFDITFLLHFSCKTGQNSSRCKDRFYIAGLLGLICLLVIFAFLRFVKNESQFSRGTWTYIL